MPSNAPHGGPGRASQRARAVVRPSSRQASRDERAPRGQRRPVRPAEPGGAPSTRVVQRLSRGAGMTRRAIAVMVVCAVLVISYASSLRVYLRQERELAVARQQIAERTAANARLSDEITRWQNPDFVRAQARQRLGWVVPGEVGYRVVDEDGKPLAGDVTIQSTSTIPAGEHATTWWERLAGSLAASDAPLVQAPTAPPRRRPVADAHPDTGRPEGVGHRHHEGTLNASRAHDPRR